MLKNIHPLLNADLLYALRAMGHGDEIVFTDANFPSDSVARETVVGRPLRIETATAADAVAAVLTLMPLDTFIEHSALRMEVIGSPEEVLPVQLEVQAVIDAEEGRSWPMGSLERFAFYERATQAYCIVQTGERRFYGNFILSKGVVPPDA
jgi:L-fucose mutarotase